MMKIFENPTSLLVCVLEIVVGILLLINPMGFTAGILIAAAIVLIGLGIWQCIGYIRQDPVSAAVGHKLFFGLCLILLGIVGIWKANWFVTTFPTVLTTLYGVAIALSGIQKIQWTTDSLRLKTGKWLLPAVSALASMLCAAIILVNPFETILVLWQVAGIVLILEAVLDLFALILNRPE